MSAQNWINCLFSNGKKFHENNLAGKQTDALTNEQTNKTTENVINYYTLKLGLQPIPFLLGHPGPSVPRPTVIVAERPVVSFSALLCAGCMSYSLEWKCVVFCTFAEVNFLAESAPESRNLQLKFQKISGGHTPWLDLTVGGGDSLPHQPRTRPLWPHWGWVLEGGHCCNAVGVPFFNRPRWQP